MPLQWRHNEHDGVSNHWHIDCLLKHLFRHRSKKTSKLRVTGLCEGNSSLRKGPVIWKMFPFDDIIMKNFVATDMLLLTHWGRAYMRRYTNQHWFRLSLGRRRAIIWTNAGMLLIETFSEILIEIQTFSLPKIYLKMSFAKFRPICLSLNVLRWNRMRFVSNYSFMVIVLTIMQLPKCHKRKPDSSKLHSVEILWQYRCFNSRNCCYNFNHFQHG